jgi:hypothetical protein
MAFGRRIGANQNVYGTSDSVDWEWKDIMRLRINGKQI